MQNLTDIQLAIILTTALLLLGGVFLLGCWLSIAKRKRQVAALARAPEQLVSLRREGPDGDGYVRLYARTTTGSEVFVANHTELEAVERQLATAMATIQRLRGKTGPV